MDTVAETSLPVLPVETPEFSADPDRFLEAARREHPWLARFSQGYVVHGYQACADLMADDRNLICGFGPVIDFYGVRGSMWARFMEEIVISQSGPAHARLRGSVAHAFTPRRANREREMMQRTIEALLDQWAPRGSFDFAEFASYFPVTVMCGLLGVSAEPIPRMRDALENQLKSLTLDPAAKPLFMAGWDVLWDFADSLVTEREASGLHDADSLLDDIIAAKQRGELDATEARFMVLTVAVAGYDTSKNQLTVTMKLLLDRPDLYRRCAEDLQFCRKVAEESLRHSAIATPYREVAHDFTYGGRQFRKGDTLVMAAPLANRDPAVFADPDRFDVARTPNPHLAFGAGIHFCLGGPLARVELQATLDAVRRKVPDAVLARPPRRRQEFVIRGLHALEIARDD